MMIIGLVFESFTRRRGLGGTERVKLWTVVLIRIVRIGIFNVSFMVDHGLIVIWMLKEIDRGWICNSGTA